MSWTIICRLGRLSVRRPLSGSEIYLEIDLPPSEGPRDPESVRAAAKAAIANLAEAVEKAPAARFAQTD